MTLAPPSPAAGRRLKIVRWPKSLSPRRRNFTLSGPHTDCGCRVVGVAQRLQFFVVLQETTRDTDRALYYCGSGSNSYDGLGAPLRRIPGPYHASRSMDCHLADAASCVQGLMAPGQPNRLFTSAWSFRVQLYRPEDVVQDRYVFRVNPCPLIPHAVWIYVLRHIIKPNLAYNRSGRGSRRGNQAHLTR